MRLAWILLAALVAVSLATENSSSTDSSTSTTVAADKTTTTEADDSGVNTVTTTEQPANTASTATPDDGNTDNTPKATTVKTTVKVDSTTKTTTLKGSTTTKEPQPDVESFSVTCSKSTTLCTYTMQVPGLDIDTFDRLIKETNDTETAVENYESTDLVNLQAGVTKVFEDAGVTADYVESQLTTITKEIKDLQTEAAELEGDINGINTDVSIAQNYLNKILNKKGSCLYRQCVLKETTTTKPKTTTTVKTTPMPYCTKFPDTCKVNGGSCDNKYDSYECICIGNLDGEENDCATSVCEIVKDSQAPGLVFSPGYYKNGTNAAADDGCDGAQWTVKATDSNKVLGLVETAFTDNINKLSADANLQLTVGKYKLKITSKTKYNQITQILAYGNTATIAYSGSKDYYFHFELTEIDKPAA
ncbi:hypothetical protein PRIPAC_92056 [Pristionchus pacificus]|uniref:Uncharacterized protein n=1 Tax=Pristionchus pacificus TaxID=54126 RepID=A0A2A6BPT6_PRIPA|nr:hypothetical protein PRIPAC_92056 [Pristionchus pacificus]|eukprot:PDM67907.1 hypothetical protein PRIPAC_45951 [Pristionchus pacificus]